MPPDILAVRRRLFEDFGFYSANSLMIRTKEQTIIPLTLNRAQRKLLEVVERQLATRGYVRIIILKGRQMGLSTAIGGWLYWWVSQRTAQKALVVAHKAEATSTLFTMTKRYHNSMPAILKPSTSYSSKKELVFDALDSSYAVVTAGGDGIARSETITAAHLSEAAFWPPGSARENYSGLMDTIPNKPGTAVFNESTANGVSNLFAEQWNLAVKGESLFEPLFLSWLIAEGSDYRLPVPEGFVRSPDEEDIVAAYGADDEQLMFRRAKIAEKGRDLFKQEYPFSADEAFLTSGRPVFNPDQITELLKEAPEPLARMALEGEEFNQHPRGELLCYAPHDPLETYYIGADVGAGVQRDWSVAQVLNSKGEQAAMWRGQVDPDYFATILFFLGTFYNEARIIVESNNHGILTCARLGKDMSYPNFYVEEVYDKITDKTTVKMGFSTNVKSKPLIIDKLRAAVRDGETSIVDRETLTEMRSYIVTETGAMEAEQGCHDDTVMALALANHINEGAFTPVVNRDDWYVRMI